MTLEGDPNSVDRNSRFRPFSILVFGVLVSGCITNAGAEFTDDLFEQYEVIMDTAKPQTVLPGFFLGGATAELVVVHIDEKDERRMQMFAFDSGAWVSVLETKLRSDVVFVAVANISGRDRLVTYERGRLELVRSRLGDGTDTGGRHNDLQRDDRGRNSPGRHHSGRQP